MKGNKVSLIVISEHIVNSNKTAKIVKKIDYGWEWCTSGSAAIRDRIWIIWHPTEVKFTLIEIHDQLIYGIIQPRHNNIVIHFSAVYGLHIVPARKELWRKLKEIEELMIHPWLIMGDFNSFLDVEDRSHENEVHEYETRDFRRFI